MPWQKFPIYFLWSIILCSTVLTNCRQLLLYISYYKNNLYMFAHITTELTSVFLVLAAKFAACVVAVACVYLIMHDCCSICVFAVYVIAVAYEIAAACCMCTFAALGLAT